MKDSLIIHEDSLDIYEEIPNVARKLRIESPIGTIESDSGNHIIDVITVIFVISTLYVGKKLVNKFFN